MATSWSTLQLFTVPDSIAYRDGTAVCDRCARTERRVERRPGQAAGDSQRSRLRASARALRKASVLRERCTAIGDPDGGLCATESGASQRCSLGSKVGVMGMDRGTWVIFESLGI